jgi:hypothetical protein
MIVFCVANPCIPIEVYHHFRGTFYTEDGGSRFIWNVSKQLWIYRVSRGIVLEMEVPKLFSMLFQVGRNFYNMITKQFPLLEDVCTLLNVECNDKLLKKCTCIKKLMLPSQKLEDKQAVRILYDIIVMRKYQNSSPWSDGTRAPPWSSCSTDVRKP